MEVRSLSTGPLYIKYFGVIEMMTMKTKTSAIAPESAAPVRGGAPRRSCRRTAFAALGRRLWAAAFLLAGGMLPASADQSFGIVGGRQITLSVTADGTQPFMYQWRKDGADLAGATGATFVIASASNDDAGVYSVVVSNSAGSTVSDLATLLPEAIAPSISSHPAGRSVLSGQSVSFSVAAGGTGPLAYVWRRNGVALADGGGISGSATATLTLTNVAPGAAGTYSVVVSNAAGTATSNGASLTVSDPVIAPAFVTQPASRTVTEGTSVSFVVSATGQPAPTYQWRKDGVVLMNGGNVSGATTATLTIANASAANAGVYTAVASNSGGVATSAAATFAVNPAPRAPAITTQPASTTVVAGGDAVFSVVASGYPAPSYRWRRDGVDLVDGSGIAGAGTATLTLTKVAASSGGVYSVTVANSEGTATSAGAALTVQSAPVFALLPVSQTVKEGANVTLTASANANPAPTYRWRKDGVDLVDGGNVSGSATATLTLSKVSSANAGLYTLVAVNAVGSATSSAAALTVDPAKAPRFLEHPNGKTARKGETLVLAATVEAAPAPSYEWTKDGQPVVDGGGVSGATTATLTLADVDSADAGGYALKATNSEGSAVSTVATVTVEVPPAPDEEDNKDGGPKGEPATATDVYPGVPAGFSVAGYLARNPEHAARFGNDPVGAWEYYRDHGVKAGELFDEEFRPEEYLGLYPELLALFGADLKAALIHWLEAGRVEGRLGRIPTAFSAEGYFERNPDVAAAMGGDPVKGWQHFWQYGIYEGRAYDDQYRAFEYIALNPDLFEAFSQDWRAATLHWLRYGNTEGRLGRVPGVFDVSRYLTLYPDVATVWGTYQSTVFQHFWYYGVQEARHYDEAFRVDEYLELNPDVAAVVNNNRQAAFMHWVRYGSSEGRRARR